MNDVTRTAMSVTLTVYDTETFQLHQLHGQVMVPDEWQDALPERLLMRGIVCHKPRALGPDEHFARINDG